MKYRKKPIVIEAVQFTEAIATRMEMVEELGVKLRVTGFGIDTLEGYMHVSIGDWIITGIKGERYPCKPDIFDATYELVEEKINA